MNPNQQLIDYQNQLLQNNLAYIQEKNNQIAMVQSAIQSSQANINAFNAQITGYEAEITALENGNILINDTIAILSQ